MSQRPFTEVVPAEEPLSLELGDLYRSHAERVVRWVHRLRGPGPDAEDLAQEVFLAARPLLGRCTFHSWAQVDSWIYRITENIVRRHRRRERWREWIGRRGESAELVASHDPGPAESLEQRDRLAFVYRVLDGLPEKYRTPFILYEIEGCSGDEVARLTGLKVGTLAVQLHRAREKFAERVARLEKQPMRSWPPRSEVARAEVAAAARPAKRQLKGDVP